MFPKVTWESSRLPEKSCDHDVFDTNKIIWFSHAKFAPTICRVSGRGPERLGVFLQNSYISKRGLIRSLANVGLGGVSAMVASWPGEKYANYPDRQGDRYCQWFLT